MRKDKNVTRRKVLKVATGSGIIAGAMAGWDGKKWTKPVVDSVLLPAHAQNSAEETGCALNVSDITYSQSSVVPGTTPMSPATNSTMTNGSYAEKYSTALEYEDSLDSYDSWVKMDLGAIYEVCAVIVGCDFEGTLVNNFGKKYTENRNVEYSTDNNSWSTAFNTGIFNQGIQTYN
ncbi:MAG: discoidin domain-containing protein, partial [Desulfobulbaceae bacterium]|nr:discoidin domain-containing protein [Desulfobulbaceae bacterium]